MTNTSKLRVENNNIPIFFINFKKIQFIRKKKTTKAWIKRDLVNHECNHIFYFNEFKKKKSID